MGRPIVYLLASRKNGTLYIGVSTNIRQRLAQHRSPDSDGFAARYGVHRLVYFEVFENLMDAREREVRLKRFRRQWKTNLIEQANPDWRDLTAELPFD